MTAGAGPGRDSGPVMHQSGGTVAASLGPMLGSAVNEILQDQDA